MDLQGSAAIVTGGTGGLGGSICEALARAGAQVAVAYLRSAELARERATELSRLGPRAIAVQADATTAAGAETLVRAALAAFGRVDLLVNNAAIPGRVPFKDLEALTESSWSSVIAADLTGPYLCSRAVAPIMAQQEQGRIVNISSIGGLSASGSSIAYSVAKAGLIHLTRCLAVALAPHVLVNCVAPGSLEGTRMTAEQDPAYVRGSHERSLLRRATLRKDVADQVVTLARSDSTTGQTIVVDAGLVFH